LLSLVRLTAKACSVKEIFLCSDKLDKYQSMGENGQAVYISALQLRETLRLRKQTAVADTLAIPQISEHGDRIDWYAPLAGDVIPWTAATEAERQAALAQLETTHAAFRQISNEFAQSQQPERRLFGKLLEKRCNSPISSTWAGRWKASHQFWGFVNATNQARIEPLDCLRPISTALPPQSASIEPVIPERTFTHQKHAQRRWWLLLPAWLRWLLPLLLLLLLALLFLRGCMPGITIPGISSSVPALPAPHLPTAESLAPSSRAIISTTTSKANLHSTTGSEIWHHGHFTHNVTEQSALQTPSQSAAATASAVDPVSHE
jgi:hypothetical protein